jgi:hypothetical protein
MCEYKNNNINFLFEEKDDKNINEEDIQKIMDELNNEIEASDFDPWMLNDAEFFDNNIENNIENNIDIKYFVHKSKYGNDELYYEEEYTVKDLLKICEYYGIDKNIRTSKCKKIDIITTLVYFESLPENAVIVEKRNRMWAYITELLQDPKMKKFIIF